MFHLLFGSDIIGIVCFAVSLIVLIMLGISLFGGDGLDTDLDLDGGGGLSDFDLGSLVSPKGLIHFIFGSSWYLVLSNYARGYRETYDWFIAIGVGLIAALLIALIYFGMYKLQCEKKAEEGDELVGRLGSIYLKKSDDVYDIFVDINGSRRTLSVKSKSGKEYKNADLTSIISYENGIYYIE